MRTEPTPTAPSPVIDVTDATFQAEVIDRSHTTPVVVDVWAEWCGPCKQLGPVLERAVTDRGGEVVLAKVDADTNPGVTQAFRVQGIPAVFGIRDGQVVAQFTGVRPEAEIVRFLDDLAPSEADRAVQRARALPDPEREAELRRALALEPQHREAAIGLGELLAERDPQAAIDLVGPHRPDPAAEAVVTRAELARSGDGGADLDALRVRADAGDATSLVELGRALAARGAYEEAIDRLLVAVELGGDVREPAREQIVALFNVLGDGDPRVQQARPRLARALF